jgi:hypothetical protein
MSDFDALVAVGWRPTLDIAAREKFPRKTPAYLVLWFYRNHSIPADCTRYILVDTGIPILRSLTDRFTRIPARNCPFLSATLYSDSSRSGGHRTFPRFPRASTCQHTHLQE